MTRGWVAGSFLVCVLACATVAAAPQQDQVPPTSADVTPAQAAPTTPQRDIRLDLRPRVCTLSADDDQCDTEVRAHWQSPRNESLCLVIVNRPEIKRCWENHAEGRYTVALAFREDLVVELRDPELRGVLVSEAIKVIREALQLRRKRRAPWSILP
jgi:hypothetical protein